MGTARRVPHHVLLARQLLRLRGPSARRALPAPARAEAAASQLDIPSRFLTPIFEIRRSTGMALAPKAGDVAIADVIDLDGADSVWQTFEAEPTAPHPAWQFAWRCLNMSWQDVARAPWLSVLLGLVCFLLTYWLQDGFEQWSLYTLALSVGVALLGAMLGQAARHA
jgi:hypothetical protein